MAFTSRKFASDLPATTLTDVTAGGLPAGQAGTYLVTFCNRTAAATTVRLALTTGGAAGAADYIEYDAPLTANGVLSRWPIPIAEGWKLFAYAPVAGVSVNMIGLQG